MAAAALSFPDAAMMRITFVRVSNDRHVVSVERADGSDLDGENIALSETISGPMQTMMRTGASVDEIHQVLVRVAPALASADLAARLHERMRSLTGHWAATPFGQPMVLDWPDRPDEP